jgi:regulatory protein
MAFFKSKRPDTPLTPDEALAKLEHFCAYRERCPKEVRAKLADLGMRGAEAEQIFTVLQDDGFFNEERFALAFAGGKFRINHWGRVRIRLELRMREIAPHLIQQALDSIGEEEYAGLLKQLLAKKRRQYENDDQAREKTAAALIRAGFEPELVFKYL